MQKLFIDFDGTIVNSVKAYCETYNIIYADHSHFKKADWTKVNKWNFEDECPLTKYYVEHIFQTPTFFNYLEFFPNAKEVLQELCQTYDVTICTIGTPMNIALKVRWIAKHLPFIKNIIMISNKNSTPNKELVNMEGNIVIDDASKNLYSCNAKYKYCFGEVKEWNEDWDGFRLFDWDYARIALVPIIK